MFQLRCALEEYKTGTYVEKDFSEKRFKKYYNKLLRNLKEYQISSRVNVLRRFCSQIFRAGRYVSSFAPLYTYALTLNLKACAFKMMMKTTTAPTALLFRRVQSEKKISMQKVLIRALIDTFLSSCTTVLAV